MMSKTTKFIFILFAFLNYSQNSDLFDQGNDFYNQGRYFEAIEKYNLILKNGSHSDELYYNLGNSYYKLNDIANILNEITKFNFYENLDAKKILQ